MRQCFIQLYMAANVEGFEVGGSFHMHLTPRYALKRYVFKRESRYSVVSPYCEKKLQIYESVSLSILAVIASVC